MKKLLCLMLQLLVVLPFVAVLLPQTMSAVVFDASITCCTAICSSPSSSNDVGRRIRGRRCGIRIA